MKRRTLLQLAAVAPVVPRDVVGTQARKWVTGWIDHGGPGKRWVSTCYIHRAGMTISAPTVAEALRMAFPGGVIYLEPARLEAIAGEATGETARERETRWRLERYVNWALKHHKLDFPPTPEGEYYGIGPMLTGGPPLAS